MTPADAATVIIVDDDALVRSSIQGTLSRCWLARRRRISPYHHCPLPPRLHQFRLASPRPCWKGGPTLLLRSAA